MIGYSRLWLVCLSAILVFLIGCGESRSTVSGTVSLDGNPVSATDDVRGTVTFYPDGGGGSVAVGSLNEAGRYKLFTGSQEGTSPGTYLVAISLKKIILPTSPDGMPTGQLISPANYSNPKQSGFRVDVKPGSNRIDFKLTSTFGE